MVGGNIDGVTRVMTTAIVLETGKGNLPLALGLGIVLLTLVMLINAGAYLVGEATRRRLGYQRSCYPSKVLFNQYVSLLLSEKKHPHLKHDLANQWHNWLLSEEGQQAIADFKADGQQLFFPNAK